MSPADAAGPAGEDGEPAPRIASDELAEVAALAARLRLGPLERDPAVDPAVIAALSAQGDLDPGLLRRAHAMVRRRRWLRRLGVAAAAALAIASVASPWWAPLAFAPPDRPADGPQALPPPLDPDVAEARAAAMSERASRLRIERRAGEAVAIARQAVALRPDEPRHAYVLAACLEAAGREHEAQGVYRGILRADGGVHDAAARLALAGLLAKEGRPGREEAVALYRRHLAAEPPSAEVWSKLAAVEAGLGRHDAALAAHRAAVALEPAAAGPRAALAEYLVARGRDAEALAAYRALIARFPAEGAYRWSLAALHERANRPKEALAEALAAGALPSEARGEAPYRLVALCDRLGRRDALIGYYEARLARSPRDVRLHEALVVELLRQDRVADAERAVTRWIGATEGAGGPARRRQGEVLARLGRDAEAVAAFEAAIAAEPRVYAGYQALAQHHLTRARGDAAMRVARLAVDRTDATRIDARLGVAEVAEGLGRSEEALAAYRDAAAADAANMEPWRRQAILLARIGRREEAIAAYGEAARRATSGYWRGQMQRAAEALQPTR